MTAVAIVSHIKLNFHFDRLARQTTSKFYISSAGVVYWACAGLMLFLIRCVWRLPLFLNLGTMSRFVSCGD